ncbi:MAG TPA: TylF/MycF/NovP-related O-methyltransferase [Acidimicrobiales bacterium]|nr:TylF/MycF/NovP-related O-methyltransferase [Acidimicrobiales bacterium]
MATGPARRVNLSPVAKAMRKPWYRFWQLVERGVFDNREYAVHVPFGQRILQPWFHAEGDTDFARALRAVRAAGPMALTPDRSYLLYELARAVSPLPGDMAECGVYTGGSAHLLALALEAAAPATTLHLFDSFQGMPEAADPARDYHAPGDFSDTSEARVRQRVAAFPSCRFHVGFMPATFDEVAGVDRYSFVHVDVDIYDSVKACCEWFWPRLTQGGAMVFDDYGFYPYRRAARAAVDEFFAGRHERPIALPTGQGLVLRTTPQT